jgi:hypothetical protein
MGTISGFVLGYVLGAKQGPEGYAKLRAAWETIRDAPEVKALLERMPTAAGTSSSMIDAVTSSPTVQSLVSTGLALANDIVERLVERGKAA